MQTPKKKNFRTYAHTNPLKLNNIEIPTNFIQCDFVDVGCGYGKFLINLSLKYPEKMIVGMEIRKKVKEFVELKIEAMRRKFYLSESVNKNLNKFSNLDENKEFDSENKKFNKLENLENESVNEKIKNLENSNYLKNIKVIQTNALLFISHFFKGSSLEKLFFLFPDPQFKKKRFKFRIISKITIPIYHYLLKENGRIYVSTDVEFLFKEMKNDILEKGFFKEVKDDEFQICETDESLRAGKGKFIFSGVFEKI